MFLATLLLNTVVPATVDLFPRSFLQMLIGIGEHWQLATVSQFRGHKCQKSVLHLNIPVSIYCCKLCLAFTQKINISNVISCPFALVKFSLYKYYTQFQQLSCNSKFVGFIKIVILIVNFVCLPLSVCYSGGVTNVRNSISGYHKIQLK